MQPLPQLESCLRLAFDARDPQHVSGVSLASWFVRAPTRGRRRSELDASLLFPVDLRARMGPKANAAITLAMDPASWRSCAAPRATVPLATREWLAEAAMALGRAEGFDLTWAFGTGERLEARVPEPPKFEGQRFASVEAALADGPKFFEELMTAVGSRDGREIVRALEALRHSAALDRDGEGRYVIVAVQTPEGL